MIYGASSAEYLRANARDYISDSDSSDDEEFDSLGSFSPVLVPSDDEELYAPNMTTNKLPCQAHPDLNYTQMMDAANKKPVHLLAQEKEAAERLLIALGNDAGVSNRISKLSNEQIRIFFPCIYVEAKHKLNPITAYNTKDRGYGDINSDDNVAMLRGYGDFLTAIKEVADKKEKGMSLDERADLLINRYYHLAETLTNQKPSEIIEFSGAARYYLPQKAVFKPDMYAPINENPSGNQPKTISCGHNLSVHPYEGHYQYGGYDVLEDIQGIIRDILKKYISSIDSANARDIIQTTVDYQFLHLLPNANGRTSQIMRDCALMHLGHLPLSSLTSHSHYLSPLQPVDLEHFSFMGKVSEEILSAIEQQSLTLSLCKKNTPALAAGLAAKATTDAIEFDVKAFLGKEAEKYFAPQLPRNRFESFV